MTSCVKIITTAAADTKGTTVMLCFDHKHYIFGSIGEGTQRALTGAGAKLMKVREVFVTGRTEWENVGGLVGLLLTVADATAASVAEAAKAARYKKSRGKGRGNWEDDGLAEGRHLSIFGAPNLNYKMATCRRFAFRQGMPIDCQEFWDDTPLGQDGMREPDFVDNNTRVWALTIMPASSPQESRMTNMNSARKRSHDEFEDNEPNAENVEETPEQKERRYADMARAVVGEMFNSNWRFDALVEDHLSRVRFPATIFVRNPQTKELEKYTGPIPNPDDPLVLVRKPWPGAAVQALPPSTPKPQAMSYIVRNQSVRGKFLAKKAEELDVPGPLRGTLAEGGTVELPDGRIVRPEEVLGPDRQGAGFVVADLPSAEYVEPFVNRAEWKSEAMMEGVGLFVWILGPGVSAHPALRKFFEEFSHVEHHVSSPDHCPNQIVMQQAATVHAQLGVVDPKRFHPLVHDNKTVPQQWAGRTSSEVVPLPDYVKPALPYQIIDLGPKFGPRELIRKSLDIDRVTNRVAREVRALADAARQSIEEERARLDEWRSKVPCPDAEIITLGTGSALPSLYRNVSATLVRVPGYGNYLLDAGENTLGQLQRVFPPDELAEVFRDLRMIWISHMHADHHLGTVAVIKAWYQHVHGAIPLPATDPPAAYWSLDNPFDHPDRKLALVADVAMTNWLAEYAHIEDYGYSRILPLVAKARYDNIPTTLSWIQPPTIFTTADEEPLNIEVPRSRYEELFGLQDLQAVNVIHCFGSRAVSLTFPDSTRLDPTDPQSHPFKVSYSGDCRPSKSFAMIGKHSTVLIHEATFEDDMMNDAITKKHSTTSEALAVGAAMRVKCALLTHFSQRYQSMPVMEREEEKDGEVDAELENGEDGKMDVDGNEALENEQEAAAAYDEDPTAETAAIEPEPLDLPTAAIEPEPHDLPTAPPKPGFTTYYPPQRTAHKTTSTTKIKASPSMRVGLAFDYMRVRVGEFAELEYFVKAIEGLFEYEQLERDKRAEKARLAEFDRAKLAKGRKMKEMAEKED
ncbi:hypothetical protein K490DRAFT_65940 [Saccharata proteae CBS 121410]|uniref:ribonuclease Z n=1 Tax=Saccharata proteae CBS 121410 TaxID=1314787 RepID=A0A9P4HV72_9PEZI|nr:hypothetical protein K490DRAFT_65940 [Saccharata proteae CBS 121410]